LYVARVLIQSPSLQTPLHYACKLANNKIMEMLLGYGADPDAPGVPLSFSSKPLFHSPVDH
jgi:ankyrin repeat protein